MAVPTKKGFSFILLVACALSLTTIYSIPIFRKADSLLILLAPVFDEQTPVVILESGSLQFDKPIPYEIELDNGVRIFFQNSADSTQLSTLPAYSLCIARDTIMFKIKDRVKTIAVSEIEINSDKGKMVLNPVKIGLFLERFSAGFIFLSGILLFLLFLLVLSLIALFAAGIGIMIDAFSNGPYSFQSLFAGAAVLMMALTVIWIIFRFSSFAQLRTSLIIYFAVFWGLVYGVIHFKASDNAS